MVFRVLEPARTRGNFLIGANTCLPAVDPRLSCQLTVYLEPEAQGTRTH
jgi:hypothetical protein